MALLLACCEVGPHANRGILQVACRPMCFCSHSSQQHCQALEMRMQAQAYNPSASSKEVAAPPPPHEGSATIPYHAWASRCKCLPHTKLDTSELLD